MATATVNYEVFASVIQEFPSISDNQKLQLASAFLKWINSISINRFDYTAKEFRKAITLSAEGDLKFIIASLKITWVFYQARVPNKSVKHWFEFLTHRFFDLETEKYKQLIEDNEFIALLSSIREKENFHEEAVNGFCETLRLRDGFELQGFDVMDVIHKIIGPEFYPLLDKVLAPLYDEAVLEVTKLEYAAIASHDKRVSDAGTTLNHLFFAVIRLIVRKGAFDHDLKLIFKHLSHMEEWPNFHLFIKAITWLETMCTIQIDFYEVELIRILDIPCADPNRSRQFKWHEISFDGQKILDKLDFNKLSPDAKVKYALMDIMTCVNRGEQPLQYGEFVRLEENQKGFFFFALSEYLMAGHDKVFFLDAGQLGQKIDLDIQMWRYFGRYLYYIYATLNLPVSECSKAIRWCSKLSAASQPEYDDEKETFKNLEAYFYLYLMANAPKQNALKLCEEAFERQVQEPWRLSVKHISHLSALLSKSWTTNELEILIGHIVRNIKIGSTMAAQYYQEIGGAARDSFPHLIFYIILGVLAQGKSAPAVSSIYQVLKHVRENLLKIRFEEVIDPADECVRRTCIALREVGFPFTLVELSPVNVLRQFWIHSLGTEGHENKEYICLSASLRLNSKKTTDRKKEKQDTMAMQVTMISMLRNMHLKNKFLYNQLSTGIFETSLSKWRSREGLLLKEEEDAARENRKSIQQ